MRGGFSCIYERVELITSVTEKGTYLFIVRHFFAVGRQGGERAFALPMPEHDQDDRRRQHQYDHRQAPDNEAYVTFGFVIIRIRLGTRRILHNVYDVSETTSNRYTIN